MMKNYYKDRDDTLRARFDGVATQYEEYRLSYPKELFQDIMRYSDKPQDALEIGIGTGKATAPFLKAGISVLAIEPNPKMADIAIEKNAGYGHLKILNGKFEDYTFNHEFDLVYAASSFQWLRSENRMELIGGCLKQNGIFAKFKTVTIVDPEESIGSRLLYDIYCDVLPDYLPKDRSPKVKLWDEFEQAGFGSFEHRDYYKKYLFDSDRYISFMNTYTEYLALDEKLRKLFEDRIAEEIGAREITIIQKCTLDMATYGKYGFTVTNAK